RLAENEVLVELVRRAREQWPNLSEESLARPIAAEADGFAGLSLRGGAGSPADVSMSDVTSSLSDVDSELLGGMTDADVGVGVDLGRRRSAVEAGLGESGRPVRRQRVGDLTPVDEVDERDWVLPVLPRVGLWDGDVRRSPDSLPR